MSFLAPYMLWGGLAAGIPIALHFFYRSRYRNVPWAAMKFLLASIEQTSRRLRFQELLLLMLRVALLVLLAFALARPSTSATGLGGRGDAVDAVLILDTSMSMDARAGVAPPSGSDPYQAALRQFARSDGSVTSFDRARAAALAVLASLPAHSTVQVIACADRAELLGPRIPSHLDQARTLIEQLPISQLTTDFLPAVRMASDLLERGPSPNKELYLFSDMQRRGWAAQSAALTAALTDTRSLASVHLVHCKPARLSNVSLAGVTPQSTLRSGERADFAVLVRNTGKQTARNLTVTLELDGRDTARDRQPVPEIRPGETRAVVLSVLLDKPGRHVLTASVRPDNLEADNRLDQIIQIADRVGVLVVDGAPDARDPRRSASFFLQHALNPLQPGVATTLPVTVVPADRAAPSDLGGKEACFLVNARLQPSRNPDAPARGESMDDGASLSDEFVRALGSFVQQGHGLVILAGDRIEPEPYNRLLFDQLRLLPYRIGKVESTPEDRPWTIDRTSADRPPFNRFRDERGYATIDRIEVRKIIALEEPKGNDALAEESRVLLRYSNGKPAIVSRQRPGMGQVVLFTTSVSDPAWSDWFIAPAFVPVVQMTLGHLLEGQPEQFNRIAGEPIVWVTSSEQAAEAHDLVLPDGRRERIGFPVNVAGRAVLTAPDTARAGLYRVVPASQEVSDTTPLFAVTSDIRETEDLETLTPAQIDEQLGFAAFHLTAGEDGAVFSGAERLKREWTVWLLAALLLLVLGEMAFAWYCGRAW